MKSRVSLLLLLLSAVCFNGTAQNVFGEIAGVITDAKTKKPLDYVSVTLKLKGVTVASTLSDDDGKFQLKTIKPDNYTILTTYIGYTNKRIENILVQANKKTAIKIELEANANGTSLKELVIEYKQPMMDAAGVKGNTKVSKEIMSMATRSVNSISGTTLGVESRSGGTPNFRGARNDGTAYYIDGVRVQQYGSNNKYVPVKSLEESREEYGKFKENVFKSVKAEPLSTFSIDVDRASYAIVRNNLNNNMLPPKDAVRLEELINYFNYNFEPTKSDMPFNVYTEVANSPWKGDKIVMVTLKAPPINMENAAPSNFVFLIDVSGSMGSPDKLPLVKSSLKMLVQNLRPQDKVALVVYAGSSGVVLDATFGSEKNKIETAIENLSAGGSTAGGEGIVLAYKIAKQNFIDNGNNRVILATDGDFNVGVTNNDELEKLISEKKESGIYLTVLGFGTGNIKDNRMEMLADKGNGNYSYVDNILEANKVLVREMGGTLYTVAKDVKLQLEFNPAFVKSYRLVGYENRMLNAEDFNNDKKDAGEIGAGHCVTAIYELILKDNKNHVEMVDDLKYQPVKAIDAASSNELLAVKIRYKKPTENLSKKVEMPVLNAEKAFASASENMRFAIAVASFGMKLKQSEFAEKISLEQIKELATNAKGTDEHGDRAEFIRLIKLANLTAMK